MQVKMIFHGDGNYEIKGETTKGKWSVSGNTLTISINNETEVYNIESLTASRLSLSVRTNDLSDLGGGLPEGTETLVIIISLEKK